MSMIIGKIYAVQKNDYSIIMPIYDGFDRDVLCTSFLETNEKNDTAYFVSS